VDALVLSMVKCQTTGSAWFSSQKIETMLGFKPEWNLEKALPEMVREMEN